MSGDIQSTSRGPLARLSVLIRREFWEHRELVWLPVAVLLLQLGLALAALVLPQHMGGNVQIVLTDEQNLLADSSDPGAPVRRKHEVQWKEMSLPKLLQLAESTPEPRRAVLLQGMALGHGRIHLLVGGFLLMLLLGRMLTKEQQTRSSLFFQSMPLTAWEYLGSKVLTAIPIGLGLLLSLIVASQLAWMGVFSGAALYHGHSALDLLWGPARLPAIWSALALQTVVDVAWWMPGLGWLVLGNALGWNARHPQRHSMISVSVIFGAVALDRLYISGGLLWDWLVLHILPPGWSWNGRSTEWTAALSHHPAGTGGPLDLALGVLLGAVLLWIAIRALRWREER